MFRFVLISTWVQGSDIIYYEATHSGVVACYTESAAAVLIFERYLK